MKKSLVPLLLFLAAPLAVFPVAAQQQDNRNLRSDLTGVYTPAQAERGHQLYLNRCARCHGLGNSGGGGGAPGFGGENFTADFEGETLFDIENRINTSMPRDQPGTTNRAQATDLVAFILSVTHVPPGRTELPADGNFLRLIRFDRPK